MKVLSGLLRYFLNINTVWGLMIVVSFVLCLVQHYLPTTTTIPDRCLKEGPNKVTIAIATRPPGKDEKVEAFDYTLNLQAGSVTLLADQMQRRKEKPWLISVSRGAAGFLLKWDYTGYGKYEVATGDSLVGKGRLVTLQTLTDGAFDYAQKGFDMALALVASMVVFLGLMKIGEEAGIVQLVARVLHPVIRFLFPEVPKDHPANGAILMNWTTSILGLGNAATPFGLKAMKELQSLNPHPEVASDSMVMFLAYNTAGLALLPTTLLAVRKAAGCTDPFEIIGTCMIGGAVSAVMAVIVAKVLGKLPMFSIRAALEEQAGQAASAQDIAQLRIGGQHNE